MALKIFAWLVTLWYSSVCRLQRRNHLHSHAMSLPCYNFPKVLLSSLKTNYTVVWRRGKPLYSRQPYFDEAWDTTNEKEGMLVAINFELRVLGRVVIAQPFDGRAVTVWEDQGGRPPEYWCFVVHCPLSCHKRNRKATLYSKTLYRAMVI